MKKIKFLTILLYLISLSSFLIANSEISLKDYIQKEDIEKDFKERRLCEPESDADSEYIPPESDADSEYIASVNFNDLEMRWIEPQIGDKVLVVREPHAGNIANNLKCVELRSMGCRLKPGTRIFIACSQDKNQGRRAWPSPFVDNQPLKSMILCSVVFERCEILEWDNFDAMFNSHRVEDRESAEAFASKKDGKLRGWFFSDVRKAPYKREYKFEPSSVIWRKFLGWK